ncbi:MAG TPA: four helix bundle protein [Bacteroidales bacterium]|nr:four helix bundle protein [Bacteroidales bacterium]
MENDKNIFFFRFEDLRIYNKALEYVNWVYANTQPFPDPMRLCLTNRFIGAAQAIAINISEGSSRGKAQFIYYLKMAKSSIRECIVYTSVAGKLGFLSESSVEDSRNALIEMTKMIGALIASLQRNVKPEDKTDDDFEDNVNLNTEIV